MKQKILYLTCGVAGSGKSTYIQKVMGNDTLWISRDKVRAEFLSDEDKNMFAYEDEVFSTFCNRIQAALDDENGPDGIWADATHLTENARNQVLDRLNLENVSVIPVYFDVPLKQIIAQNENREGRTYVPQSVIRKMYSRYKFPTYNEKHKYAHIVKIMNGKVEDVI